MFLLSLTATCQVCTVALKAGLYTYNGVQVTAVTLRSTAAPDAQRWTNRAVRGWRVTIC